ncbi:MAG TPA: hypothetical protein VLL54_02685 [Pyrinomonadaceae bacterium]|nr:hypothetical protein [Pyrinomonadaceae bacterium]
MTILDNLATALGRRDEVPNQELAQQIRRKKDQGAIKELVANLESKNKNIQSDCIKVLYEIGEHAPQLIAPYYREFGKLLESKNNRLVWGAMTALDSIATHEPKGVYGLLARVMNVADTGSVITRDHAVGILVKLGSRKQYAGKCLPLLLDQLRSCPNNQFPMYAEMSLAVANEQNKTALRKVLTQRTDKLEKESQKKRITRVLKRLEKQ